MRNMTSKARAICSGSIFASDMLGGNQIEETNVGGKRACNFIS